MSLNSDLDKPGHQEQRETSSQQWCELQDVCRVSVEYFSSHQDENSVRIKAALLVILDHLEQLQPLYREIAELAPQFDYDENTPGNGYRSFLMLVDKCIVHTNAICQQMYRQKDHVFFAKGHHMK